MNDFTKYDALDNISNKSFIKHIVKTLKGSASEYVDCFIIQDNQQKGHNCLIYFSNNRKGFEKFVETKWKIDSECGQGFEYSHTSQSSFLDQFYQGDLKTSMLSFIAESTRTNIELRDFCYDNGFIPKHGTDSLRTLHDEGLITIASANGSPLRKNTFYMSEGKEVKVLVSVKHD